MTADERTLPVGVACERLPLHADDSALETVRRAAKLGLEVIAFPSSRAVSSELDPAELDAVGAEAGGLGLAIEVGVGRVAWVDGHEDLAELDLRFDAAVRAGATELTAYTTLDRFAGRPFAEQLDDLVRVMQHLADRAAGAGVHVSLESHEDLSSFDVLEVLERVDAPLGVNLDLPNLVVRGEDPIAATRRLAAHVRQTQVEDVEFSLTPDGLHRHLAACGEGIIDWNEVVRLLVEESPCRSLCIEQHRGQFDAQVFRPEWLAAHPALPADEPLGLVGHAVRRGAPVLATGAEPPARSEDDIAADLVRSAAVLRDAVSQISRSRRTGSSAGVGN